MSKKFDKELHKNQGVRAERTEERLRALLKDKLIRRTEKKLKPSHVARLQTLRYKTIEQTLESLKQKKKVSHFHKTHPTSNVPNFQGIRHDYQEKSRFILETDNEFHNINPQVFPQTPLKQHPADPKLFQSGGGRAYAKSRTQVNLNSNLKANILRRIDSDFSQSALGPDIIRNDENATARVDTVALSYADLNRTGKKPLSINNKRAQGGYSANDLAQLQQDEFLKGLVELGLANPEEATEFAAYCEQIHYEHTHKLASHFGILKSLGNQTIDPRATESTFVAPAALNTEMMLFEKFADFLLFKNHRSNGFRSDQKSIEYTCALEYIPNTTQVSRLKLQIKDYHTGKTFTQTWDEPYKVIDRPPAARYTALLSLLKASLVDAPLLGSSLGHKNSPN